MLDTRDGEIYLVVKIGDQYWMGKNLRFNAAGSFLNNNPSTYYGRLYNWSTLMDGGSSSMATPSGMQGVCPSGWHLPSNDEWSLLSNTIIGQDGCSGLKSSSVWNDSGNETNSSGFNVLPAGVEFLGSFSGWEITLNFGVLLQFL